jgi:hypothetical protein
MESLSVTENWVLQVPTQKLAKGGMIMDRNVIAAYCIGNAASVNIYEIEYDIVDRVLAGINNEEPEWYDIVYDFDNDDEEDTRAGFMMGEWFIPLDECMKVEFDN